MMCTSGSSGGDAQGRDDVSTWAVSNRLLWAKTALPLAAGERVLVRSASLAFDASITETFEPLIAGAEVVMAPLGLVDPRAVVRLVRARGVAVIDVVPAVLEVLVSDREFSECHSLKRILCGGEALSPTLARKALACLDVTLSNNYGPTEACVDVTWFHLTRGNLEALGDGAVPIGRPLQNVRVYVLDRQRQPVPIGVTGELYLAGLCLADGYWQRADLTAEAFLDDPFASGTGARMYRTGDLARFRADGALEFLGRADDQVKIRGVRIEPAEVEAAFRQIPSIRDVAVVLAKDTSARLLAYLVTDGPGPDDATLRRELRDTLPDAMIPSTVVRVEALPRTVSGKLDRCGLPEVPVLSARPASAPARTPTETQLAVIWCDVLGVAQVGADDDFFLRGGHSLLAMALIHRVHETFTVPLAPTAIFREPTLAGLARLIDASRARSTGPLDREEPTLVQLARGGRGAPFYWVHGIGGEVVSYLQVSRYLGERRPVYGFAADWSQGRRDQSLTLESMASRLVAGPAASRSRPGRIIWVPSARRRSLALEMARQLASAGQTMGAVAVIDYDMRLRERSPSGLGAALAFARNLPHWIRDDAIPSGASELVGRLRSRLRFARQGRGVTATDIRDRLGMWHFPGHQVPMLTAHSDAFQGHSPRPWNGRVLLLLPRTRPVLGPWPVNPSADWARLAGQGVDVQYVPGSHSTMLAEPFAREVAGHVNAAIERADAAVDEPVAAVAVRPVTKTSARSRRALGR